MSLRICYFSNSPLTNTGYGVQTALTVPRLKALGHDVVIRGFYGVQGAPLLSDDTLILPTSKDDYGNDVIIDDFRYWKADIILSLVDAWIFNPAIMSQVRWVPY